jgi:hypothetical protein
MGKVLSNGCLGIFFLCDLCCLFGEMLVAQLLSSFKKYSSVSCQSKLGNMLEFIPFVSCETVLCSFFLLAVYQGLDVVLIM